MKIGQIYFDRYEVVGLLGDGGTSKVYQVRHIKLGNYWAIKAIDKNLLYGDIVDEAYILKELNHHAIPKIVDIEDTEKYFYIIEEYICGETLKAHKVKVGDISKEQIVNWSIELVNVISYLHGQLSGPIIYRDIKPENIMITKEGQLKLVDFGIARVYKENLTKDTMPLGSRGYCAPEQFGGTQSDERTDIYGLGVTIYFMLTGRHLGEPPYSISEVLLEDEDVSNILINIVKKCCEPIPSNRYQKVDAVMEDLKSLQEKQNQPVKKRRQKLQNKRKLNTNVKEYMHKGFGIGICGAGFGVGSTHISIMMAGALAKHYRVALVSVDQSRDFEEILMTLDGCSHVEGNTFKYQQVTYAWDEPYESFWYKNRNNYDFILWDFGELTKKSHLGDYLKCDKQFVVCHLMDWKIRNLIEFYETYEQYDEDHLWRYIIPFCDEKDMDTFRSFIDNPVFPAGFYKNPFKVNKELVKWVKRLLKD